MCAGNYNSLDNNQNNCCEIRWSRIALATAVILIGSIIGLAIYQVWFSGNDTSMVHVFTGPLEQSYPPPPPHTEYAAMARYIVHISDWVSMATVSTHAGIEGYPFTNIFSMSDGLPGNSTGTPYMYLTVLELSVLDLEKDPRATLTASLAQSTYCSQKMLDPQDPQCGHVILSGEIIRIQGNTTEAVFAKKVLFERHPEMDLWPADHDWFFAKLDIRHIYLLDYFGGAVVVDPKAYYAAAPYNITRHVPLIMKA